MRRPSLQHWATLYQHPANLVTIDMALLAPLRRLLLEEIFLAFYLPRLLFQP